MMNAKELLRQTESLLLQNDHITLAEASATQLHNALSTYQLFYKAFNETSSDKPFALEMLEACLTEILIIFYRSMNALGRTYYFSKANKQTEDELVNSVIEILNSGDLCERRLGDLGREIDAVFIESGRE